MLVSALLTSVGINTALCISFCAAYSVLKKQPSNFEVYRPRLLVEGKCKQRGQLVRLVPSAGWVRKAWNLTEEDILLLSGLDGVVFMRLISFCLRIFTFAAIIGIFIILPVNCFGNQLEDIDFVDISNNSLDLFTISNVNNGSKWLWVHFSAVYIVTLFILFMLYYEYKYISAKRIDCFRNTKPQPHHFTILVRSIPVAEGTRIRDTIESFFKEYHPSTYLSHIVIHRKNKIQSAFFEAKRLCKKLTFLQSDSDQHKYRQNDGHRAFLVHNDDRRLNNIEENIRLLKAEVSLREVQAAFISFKSRYGAAVAFHMQQSVNPTKWLTEEAPEPNDVYWPLFSSSFMGRWISKLLIIVACTLLTILFLIPVVFVQGLTNLNQLETWFPDLTSILTRKIVSQVITGYLPNLILQIFLIMVPPIMKFLSSIQGCISNSCIEKSACNKVLWFYVWNVFFATVFSGSILYQISIFLDPTHILPRLGISVPAQASFFVAYVVTSGWTSVSSELCRIFPLICSILKRVFVRRKGDDVALPSIRFHRDIPRICFFALLGITYFFLAPLILPFLLVYFFIGYIIFRNQLLNVYAPKYESEGNFWPIIHNSVIFSLVLMHGIAVGIFSLKKLPEASSFMLPLPILTLLFNEYCRKRFLPMFISYSAETLIERDREDQSDANMPEFYDKLAIAYRDPALMQKRYSADSNGLSSPLLYSEDVQG